MMRFLFGFVCLAMLLCNAPADATYRRQQVIVQQQVVDDYCHDAAPLVVAPARVYRAPVLLQYQQLQQQDVCHDNLQFRQVLPARASYYGAALQLQAGGGHYAVGGGLSLRRAAVVDYGIGVRQSIVARQRFVRERVIVDQPAQQININVNTRRGLFRR